MSFRESFRHTLIVACLSVAAGVPMLLHDILIAARFSISSDADAYQLAISFPMLAINVFGGGTLLALLVPRFSALIIANKTDVLAARIQQYRKMLFRVLLWVCGIWAVIFPVASKLMAGGFSSEGLMLSMHLLWISLPAFVLAGLAGINAAILTSHKLFSFSALSPAFLPGGALIGVLALGHFMGIYAAALGLVVGALCLWSVGSFLSRSVVPHADFPIRADIAHDARLNKGYWHAVLAAIFLGGIHLTDIFVAASQPQGSAATYGYATRPVILLLAFATAAFVNVSLTFFSRLVAAHDWRGLKHQYVSWLLALTMGSIPIVVYWYMNADDLVGLLYVRGKFGDTEVIRVSKIQTVYLLQIPFFLTGVLGWRLLNSLGENRKLVYIAALAFVTNLVADMLLIPVWGLAGVAWGTNLAYVVWSVVITTTVLSAGLNGFASSNSKCNFD